MAIKKADAPTANEVDLTSQDIIDFQEKFNIKDPKKIQSSDGFQVSLAGMTDIEKATALQTAIDNTGNFGWVYAPPGTYDANSAVNPTITITYREFTLMSFGRSQCVIKNSGGNHALVLDATGGSMYRMTIMNLIFSTPKSLGTLTGDALHCKGVTSAARAINIHINEADRDALHIDDGFKLISDLQLTNSELETGIGRYAVYMDNVSFINANIVGGGANKYYFGAGTERCVINNQNLGTIGFFNSSSDASTVTDLGLNNKINTIEAINNFRDSDKKTLLLSGGNVFPVNSADIYVPFTDFNSTNIFDHSPNNQDFGSLANISIVKDDFFGNVPYFNGSNSLAVVPDNPIFDLGGEFFTAIWVYVDVINNGADDTGIVFKRNTLEFFHNNYQIGFKAFFNNAGTKSRTISIVTGRWIDIYACYDGDTFEVGSYSLGDKAISTITSDTIALSGLPLEAGRRLGNFFQGKIAHYVLKKNFTRDYIVGFYNLGAKSLNFSQNAIDRGGRNKMKAPFNLAKYTDATRPTLTADDVGATIFNTDDTQMNIWNGTNWTLSDGTIT